MPRRVKARTGILRAGVLYCPAGDAYERKLSKTARCAARCPPAGGQAAPAANPNIQPRDEYDRRLYWQRELIRQLPTPEPVDLLACDYDGQRYIDAVRGLEREPEGGARCTVCFRLRLEETARQARAHGFDFFGTTLTVSPHKDAQRLNAIGAELAQQYGVRWLPSDFKKREGYKRSIELSKQYGLYRQEYCGCLYSKPVDNAAAGE